MKKNNEVCESLSLSEQNTITLGKLVGNLVHPGICILFYGELGAGKTVFIRGICEALGIESRIVRSPSFTLVNEYKGVYPVAHADLYRLEGSKNAIESLSLNEYADEGYVLLVEWAENGDFYMDNILSIKIETNSDNKDMRKFAFSAIGQSAKRVLTKFASIVQEQ
jgi:tRNA threonylcarbamoyladenosine biosynthesis protein TsaE